MTIPLVTGEYYVCLLLAMTLTFETEVETNSEEKKKKKGLIVFKWPGTNHQF